MILVFINLVIDGLVWGFLVDLVFIRVNVVLFGIVDIFFYGGMLED